VSEPHAPHPADDGPAPVRVISRTIVTSQPDIACDVCGRRLLRGEQPEIFLAAGQPRTVCELCAPRAAHQGWKRGAGDAIGEMGPSRTRRARGLIERLRAGGRSLDGPAAPADEGVFDGAAEHVAADAAYGEDLRVHADASVDARGVLGGPLALERGPLVRAVELFNEGEYPRRIGGVARSLGPPEVNVRELDVVGVVAIVVAWELCWYRYRVDVDDPSTGATLIAQGTELSELDPLERDANAAADERGALYLLAAE
jgi:hypothetical protein